MNNQVTKNAKYRDFKDKMLLIGVCVICILIGIGGFLPKHKTKTISISEEKQDTKDTLNQNMELISQLQENQNSINKTVDYHLTNPNHLLKPEIQHRAAISKETLARMNAPSTFFSMDTTATAKSQQSKTLTGRDTNSDFLNQQSDITSVSAKQLPHPNLTIPAGEMIPATLETAINSELAGMARAITSRDIYAWAGNKLLIPKGSTLVGQFNSAITQGQNRIFIVWDRVQMTNGIIVTLNSPSTDTIGRAGQAADYIDRHFFERFGSSALLSVLGAYTATSGVNGQDEYNSLSQYRMNIAGSFQHAANQNLQQDMQLKPILQINQGTSINVFVAHDLDFYRVAGRI